ncbi:hypothetical protein TorRG33x02_052670, partial [Trema orientale]
TYCPTPSHPFSGAGEERDERVEVIFSPSSMVLKLAGSILSDLGRFLGNCFR